jgi:hypothetical protein
MPLALPMANFEPPDVFPITLLLRWWFLLLDMPCSQAFQLASLLFSISHIAYVQMDRR